MSVPAMVEIPGYTVAAPLFAFGAAGYCSAVRSRDGAPVTLKFLVKMALLDERLDALRREHCILSRLFAPDVPKALELVEAPGASALAFEPFEGDPLDLMLRDGPLPASEAAAVALAVCRTLKGVHSAGVLHNALSRESVFLLDGGRAMLLEFGAASRLEERLPSARHDPEHSFACVSPERTLGADARIDARSDLYALGCLLHEMLLGKPPFAAEDPLELLHRHLAKRPVPLSEVDPAIPGVLSNLAGRLLEKEPQRRPDSADEVARILAAFLEEAGQARPARETVRGIGDRRRGFLEAAEPSAPYGPESSPDEPRRSVSSLELAAVVKSVRAISAQVDPHGLLATFLAVLAERAGADKAFYFETHGGGPELRARYSFSGDKVESEVLHPDEARFVTEYSAGIVRQAAETGKTAIVSRPGGCVLCVPVLRGGRELGLAYLENTLYSGAFSSQRVKLVELLCAQAAVSLENMRLSLARKADEVKYQSLFDNAAMGMLVVSVEGSVLDANPAAAKIFGYDSAEALVASGKSIGQSIEVDPAEGERLLGRLRLGRIIKNHELAARRGDGAPVWVSVSARPVFNEEGRLASVEAMVADVTARRQAQVEILNLNRELLKIQENERQRIARDLHDDVAQDLSSVKIGCSALLAAHPELTGEAAGLGELLQAALAKVRDLSHALRPPNLDQFGLARSLYLYCRDFEESSGIRVDFQAAGMERLDLGFEVGIHVYRIVQEALGNIRKHAAASEARVRLVAAHPCVILRISDNGRGFDEARPRQAALEKRMGLLSLRERARLLGGAFAIQSKPGEGTRIIVEFPCKETGNG